MLKVYLMYSKERKAPLYIKPRGKKSYEITVIDYNGEKVYYNFSNGMPGQIWIKNIEDFFFKSKEDETFVKYAILDVKYNQKNIKGLIDSFKSYYMEILELLQKREKVGSIEEKYCNTKKAIYNGIFENISSDPNNLLLSYFTGFVQTPNINPKINIEDDPILLLQQSNQSQKKAISTMLKDRASLIEGPPGTGKTTTIINIISNLLYKNKKVLVVSKNNPAIDNVVEELDKMNLPKCYIRLGNIDVMDNLWKVIDKRVKEYKAEVECINKEDCEKEIEQLKQLALDLNKKEEKLNELIKEQGELNELENQLRHVEKKNDAYNISSYEQTLKRSYQKIKDVNSIRNKIEHLSKMLIKISDEEKINLFEKFVTYLKLSQSVEEIEQDGIRLHLALEEKYLNRLIEQKKRTLRDENIKDLKKEVENLYLNKYTQYSKKVTIQSIWKNTNKTLINNLAMKEYEEDDDSKKKDIKKDDIIELYPVILTTVDAALTNLDRYFKNGKKIDYVIIDEASQCDILSALPLMYIAKNIVVVGDCKQLSAIINIKSEQIKYSVNKEYDYTKETFLSTISKIIKPEPNLLMEHYRCDYNIINYCNKYFYENKLIIYKEAKEDAISIINADKGKYVTRINSSFANDREIETINDIVQDGIENKFAITPFRAQANHLIEKYNKQQCGTIHTFQGKGADEVYFTTVLNNTEESINHLNGNHNLFNKELINVAVSRAKNKFVMITDKKFFKKHDKNVRNLIEYIEVYGKDIPDKTVCLFDYLYKQISTYKITDNCSNIYEKTLRDYLIKYLEGNEEYWIKTKLPLAELITDKKFLDENPDIEKFILHKGTHTDFVIYKEGISKPVLVIELDGKYHDTPQQIARDNKKDFALNHMEIKLWRYKSKYAYTEEQFFNKLDELLKEDTEQEQEYVEV